MELSCTNEFTVGEMVAQHIAIKEAEWAKYLAANGTWEETIGSFTEWEKQTYLPYL